MIEIFCYLKSQEFINELGKTFSIGENGINPLEIQPILQNTWPRGSQDVYLQTIHMYMLTYFNIQINISYIFDLICSKKTLSSFIKYAHSKLVMLDPSPLVSFIPGHFTSTPSQHTFALVSYPTAPSQKKFWDAYEFLNEKLGSEKRKKNYFHSHKKCKKTSTSI